MQSESERLQEFIKAQLNLESAVEKWIKETESGEGVSQATKKQHDAARLQRNDLYYRLNEGASNMADAYINDAEAYYKSLEKGASGSVLGNLKKAKENRYKILQGATTPTARQALIDAATDDIEGGWATREDPRSQELMRLADTTSVKNIPGTKPDPSGFALEEAWPTWRGKDGKTYVMTSRITPGGKREYKTEATSQYGFIKPPEDAPWLTPDIQAQMSEPSYAYPGAGGFNSSLSSPAIPLPPEAPAMPDAPDYPSSVPTLPASSGSTTAPSPVSVPELLGTGLTLGMDGAFVPKPITFGSSFDKVIKSSQLLSDSVLELGAAPGQPSAIPKPDVASIAGIAATRESAAQRASGIAVADYGKFAERMGLRPTADVTTSPTEYAAQAEQGLRAITQQRASGKAVQDMVGGLDQLKNMQKTPLAERWNQPSIPGTDVLPSKKYIYGN